MFKRKRMADMRSLKSHCHKIGRDLEVRGGSKYVVRWDGKRFFVFNRSTGRCSTVPSARLGRILTAMRAGKLWTCEGLRFDQILKWPWQIRLAQEKGKADRLAAAGGATPAAPAAGRELTPTPNRG